MCIQCELVYTDLILVHHLLLQFLHKLALQVDVIILQKYDIVFQKLNFFLALNNVLMSVNVFNDIQLKLL